MIIALALALAQPSPSDDDADRYIEHESPPPRPPQKIAPGIQCVMDRYSQAAKIDAPASALAAGIAARCEELNPGSFEILRDFAYKMIIDARGESPTD